MPENETTVKGFFLHFEQVEALCNVPPENIANVLKACMAYCKGQDPDFSDPFVKIVFPLMRAALDKSMAKAAAGRSGGQANGSKAKQSEANGSKAKQSEANGSKAKQSEANGSKAKQGDGVLAFASSKKEQEQEQQEEINTHPPTPLKGGGVASDGEKPSRSRETAAAIRAAIDERVESPELREALHDFAAMRERLKKPLTLKGVSLTLRDLTMLASTDADRVAIVEQSIQRGWLGMFAKHDDTGGNPRASPTPQRPQAKPGDFDPDRQAQIMRNVLARHMAREAQEAKQ